MADSINLELASGTRAEITSGLQTRHMAMVTDETEKSLIFNDGTSKKALAFEDNHFVSIPTIADMKALTLAMARRWDKITPTGYHNENDGKAFSKYYWDNDSTATVNGGTVIGLDVGGTGRYLAITHPGQPITPYNFGAKGDGTTDDTTAFQNILSYTNNIYLPEGNFRITSTLEFSNNDPETSYGVKITGDGMTRSYIYGKEITGPLFKTPITNNQLDTYFSDFTLTGSNELSFGDVVNCSTTLTGIIGSPTSTKMTNGFTAERVWVTGIATTSAKAWDLSNMFNVNLKSCRTQSIFNGYAYYCRTLSETSTTIQISDSYATGCKQGYEFIDILDISFTNQCIFESMEVVGASFWSNISFYDVYLEDIGNDTGLGVSLKALDPLYDSSTPALYYANGISGTRAYVNTAFYDVGGCLTFYGGEFTSVSVASSVGFFQGVGLGNGSSAGGKVTFMNVRDHHIVGNVIFYEQERNGYVYEVNDRQDRVLTSNRNLIKTIAEARKVTHGVCFVRDTAGTFSERFKIENGRFIFGYLPNTSYTTPPTINLDEYLPYENGDKVRLSTVSDGSGLTYRVYGKRNDLATGAMIAGETTVTIADTSYLRVGYKVIIELNSGFLYTDVASITDGNDFIISDAIPLTKSVSIGAHVFYWVWEKSDYGQYISDTMTFKVSPSFTAGLSLTGSLGGLYNNAGLDDDASSPAMTVTDRRFVNFLNSNGSNSDAGFILTNSLGNLVIGNSGQTKFRADPEGLVFGQLPDDPALICGTGAPGTGQTFTASSSSGLLLTYANDIPNFHRVRFTTTTTLPTGISAGTDYFIIRVSTTTCKVATSRSNAIAGTAIAYTDAGTGTHTVQLAHKKGSIYSRLDGSAVNNRMYVNIDGAFEWTNVTTAT